MSLSIWKVQKADYSIYIKLYANVSLNYNIYIYIYIYIYSRIGYCCNLAIYNIIPIAIHIAHITC